MSATTNDRSAASPGAGTGTGTGDDNKRLPVSQP